MGRATTWRGCWLALAAGLTVQLLAGCSATPAAHPALLAASIIPTTSQPAAKGYNRRYQTIAHEILDLEATVTSVDPSAYALLDDLIDQARARIKPIPPQAVHADKRQIALDNLHAIDQVLIANHFVYPGLGLTQLLSSGLKPKDVTADEVELVLLQEHNRRRQSHLRAHPGVRLHLIDCDTGTMIYLAIGEALGLPLALVEAPGHTFVRWYLSDQIYINWETMDGGIRVDDFYRKYWKIPPDLVARGVYLRRMSRPEVMGYAHFLAGGVAMSRIRYQEGLDHFRQAARLHPRSPAVQNDLAWALLTCPLPRYHNPEEARDHALAAVILYRYANYLDTLACAYAALGDFDTAVRLEVEACSQDPSREFIERLEGFKQRKTWLDLHPPGVTP